MQDESVPLRGAAPSRREFVYLGLKSCGCGVAACVDDPTNVEDLAEAIAEFMREGLIIERVPMDDFPSRFKGCKCTPKGGG